ncbi:MAG: PAS domain S-box protein [Betaproteobacteria bacterium]|nr:PAS domain S-box protein [Betaproteobacteria bacterium]
MTGLLRGFFSRPSGALDEQEFQRRKWEDFRSPTAAMGVACAIMVFSLWVWDWAIDAVHAPDTLGLRILLAVSILAYPLVLLIGWRQILATAFYAMLLWLQVLFLWVLGTLEGGAVHGIAGFLFWFIVPPLLTFILPLSHNILGNLAVMLFPNIAVAVLGILPEMDLWRYNALVIPAGLVTIAGHFMLDSLLRRVYEYRAQAEWRAQAIDALAEGVVVLQAGAVRYANTAAAQIIGTEPGCLIDRQLRDLVALPENAETGGVIRLSTCDGRAVWVNTSISQTQWRGAPAQLVAVTDVSQQQLAEEALRRSEQRYRDVVDNVSEGIMVVQDERFVFANASVTRLTGYDLAEITGKRFLDFVAPDHREIVYERFQRRLRGEPLAARFEFKVLRRDGRSIWARLSGVAIAWDERPAVLYFFSDVDEQHQAQEALRLSEQRYRQVVDNVTEGILVVQDGRFVFVNEAMQRITGYAVEQILGRSNLDFVVPEQREMVKERYERRIRGEPLSSRFDFQIILADGGRMWARLSGVVIEWSGRPAMLYFFSDIDAQHRAEEALQQSEERYREVIDNVSEGITVVQNQRFVFCNPSMARLTGYTLEAIYAMDSIYALADESAWPTLKERAELRSRGEPVEMRYEFQLRCKDGTTKWVELSVVTIEWQGAPATLSFVIDTTHRHEMEQALRLSQQRYRNVIDNMGEGLMVVQDGRIALCNPSAAALSGYQQEELYRWENVDRLAHPDDRAELAERNRRRMAGEAVADRYEFRLLRGDGSVRFMEMSVVLIDWDGRPATLGFMFDSTERHEIQEALRRSEANYRHVIENSPVGIAIVRSNRLLLANRALCSILGQSEQWVLERGSFLDQVHEDDYPRMAEYSKNLPRALGETAANTTFRLRLAPNRVIWVEGSTVQVEWQGRPATLSFLQDVTARVRLEESLKQTLAERETILERSIVGIALLDPQGRLRWANQAMSQIFGNSLRTAAGTSLEAFYPSRDVYLETGAAVSSAVKRGEPFETELKMRRENGALFWAHLSGKAVNVSDLSQGTVWAVMDIDQRKRLEEELQRTSSEREVILQSTLVGIIYSRDRHHVWVNRAFADMVGYTPEDLIGQSSRLHFKSEESYREFGERGYATMATGAPWSTEWELLRRDGSTLWTQILGRSLDPAQPQAGSIWTLVDITARKKAEAEVRAALEKQQELNELKSRFVSMTSHEFRTPLATILSSAELMKYYGDRLPDSERGDLLLNIEKAVGRMTGMLNDVLLLGRADAGRLDFKPAALDVVAYCRTLVDEAVRAETAEGRRGDRVRLAMPEAPLWAALDEKLMRHVLGNLLANAHKYAPEATPIEFRLEAGEHELRFSVRDQGIGIPPEDLPHLFESFHRARNVGNIQGTGLGLAIVKKAIDRHGGRVEVQSELGVGTTFTISIPR